ncbi:HEAT repeat domain containing protein [Acanthamoeba castellanii str. Neff]|uniref:HEAT repeat domain containing protein n=1 Tax=Acanthamoeba castellanii (strain ATCC 30010 / Neff) TaxID=1257118 RepID=L8H4W3_ACACF|nr:HEAT repeat domain containing protein [Acanthamoeba castellanii str. Neff]ELR19496.1 HEAT repeat domain containing protein [Acanthamoeba castellanii str. Neff]
MMNGGDADVSTVQPTSPNPAVTALEAKIMAYQNINEGGTKGRNTNLQKLEVLWDLDEVVSAAQGGPKEASSSSSSSRKRTHLHQEGPASAQLAKLAELLLASLTHPVGPGPPIRRLLAASLALLHSRVATRQLFTLVDALHATLTTKTHPLLAKLTALHGLREAYALRGDDLDALLPTSVQVVAKLFKASDTRLAQEALLTVAALDKHVGVLVEAMHCARELARIQCPTGPDFEKLVARLMKHMGGPHATVRKTAGRTLGALLSFAVERQTQQASATHAQEPAKKSSSSSSSSSKDIIWTLQSAAAYLAFLYNKSGVKREARGALAEAFVAYLKALPASSLESADNLALVLTSVLALLAAPRAHSPLDTLQALANTKIGVTAPADPALDLLQASLPPQSLCRVQLPFAPLTGLPARGFAKRMGEGAQQLLLRLLVGSLPSSPAANPGLALTLLQEISFVVLLLGEGAAQHATLVADAIPPLLAAGADLQAPLPWHLGPLLNQCFNHVTAAHAEVTCAKSPHEALKVAWAVIASIMVARPHFLQDELPNLVPVWKAHLATSRLIGRDEATVTAFCRSKRPALAALHSLCAHVPAAHAEPLLPHILSWLLSLLEVGTNLVKLTGQVSRECASAIMAFLHQLLGTFLALPPSEYPLQAVALLRVTSHLVIDGGQQTSLLDLCLPDEDRVLTSPYSSASYHVDGEAELLVLDGPLEPSFMWAPASVHSPALDLFALLFVEQTEKNRQQLIDHLTHALKDKCISVEQPMAADAITVARNVLCAVLHVLRSLIARGGTFSLSSQKLLSSAHSLILGCQGHGDSVVRALVGECMGALGRIEGTDFTDTIMPLFSAPRIKTISDVASRASSAFIVGSIHRTMGMKAGGYVSESVETLSLLIRDAAPEVYLPALHALTLVINSAGLQVANSGYGKGAIVLLLSRLMAEVPEAEGAGAKCYRLVGRAMNALVAILGPELSATPTLSAHVQGLARELRAHPDEAVAVEWLQFVEQALLFLQPTFQVGRALPHVTRCLLSPYVEVRVAALQCLRQCAQADPQVLGQVPAVSAGVWATYDAESQPRVQEQAALLLRLLAETCGTLDPGSWLAACKQLATTTSRSLVHKTLDSSPQLFAADAGEEGAGGLGGGEGGEGGGGGEGGCAASMAGELRAGGLVPRCRTRALAVMCLRDVLRASAGGTGPASSSSTGKSTGRAAVGWLADLVAVGFTAATATVHTLRPHGLGLLQDVILQYADAEDEEAAGHSVLEQYQSQIAAALRPAFERETAQPDATVMAVDVLVAFFRFNVSSDPVIFRRLTALLIAPLPEIAQIHYAGFSDEASTRVRVCFVAALAHLHDLTLPPPTCFEERPSILPANAATLAKLLRPHYGAMKDYWVGLVRDFAVGSTCGEEGQKIHAQKARLALYDLSLVPLPPAVLALYRQAVPTCLHALASLVALPSLPAEKGQQPAGTTAAARTTDEERLTREELEIVLGLCMRYCLEAGALPRELRACLLAIETLLTSAHFATPAHRLSSERLRELVSYGVRIADRHKATPLVAHAVARVARQLAILLTRPPYIDASSRDDVVDGSSSSSSSLPLAEELVPFVLRPLLPLARGLNPAEVGAWWPSTSLEAAEEALLALPPLVSLLVRWVPPLQQGELVVPHAACFLLLALRALACTAALQPPPPAAAAAGGNTLGAAALQAMKGVLEAVPVGQRRTLAEASLQQALPLLAPDEGTGEREVIGAVGLLLAELTTLHAAAEEARPFPRRLHESVALRIADVLRSHSRAPAIEAALALLQSLALVASSPHAGESRASSLPLYYLRTAAPHAGLLLHRLPQGVVVAAAMEADAPQAGGDKATSLCLQATRLLLALWALCPREQGEGVMGLLVAGLVAQLREEQDTGGGGGMGAGRALEVLTQVGAAHPAAFKQAVGCLPPAPALRLHSAVRSAALSSAARQPGTRHTTGAAASKAPRLDFSRYNY